MKRKNDDEDAGDTKKEKKATENIIVSNYGAGYNADDKRIIRAIEFYETKLKPFILDNSSIFKNSNFLTIRGYAIDIVSSKPK